MKSQFEAFSPKSQESHRNQNSGESGGLNGGQWVQGGCAWRLMGTGKVCMGVNGYREGVHGG